MSNNNINNELERAVSNKNLEEVRALLSAGADVNFISKEWSRDGNTLLHDTDSVEIVKELLSRGAEVNARNMYRETPLHRAITEGKGLELVRELLKHGVDVNATNSKRNTALNHALTKSSKNLALVKELLEYGADINIRNLPCKSYNRTPYSYQTDATPLDNAVALCETEGNLAFAKLLIRFTLIRNFNNNYERIIDLAPYSDYRNYSRLSRYLDDCVSEVIQMKTDEIKDGLPLYELFAKKFDIDVLCNNQLSLKLAKIDYSERYPIYNDIILDKLKPFLDRVDLLNKLSKIQFYTIRVDIANQDVKGGKIILDYDSTYNITEYLSNGNLLNFVVAFDDSNPI